MVIPNPVQKYQALGNILADSAAKTCRSHAQTSDLHEAVFDIRRREEDIHKKLCDFIVECNL